MRPRKALTLNTESIATSRRRAAFTLVEILVAIGIMVLLMTLVLAFWPKREVVVTRDAAGNLQSYLASAKARAIREQRPIGVRFLSDDGNRTFHAAQLLETASVWAPINPGGNNGALTIYLDLPAGNLIQQANQNNGPVVGNVARQVGVPLAGNVQVGDILEIVEVTPSQHRIMAINYNTNTMTLAASKSYVADVDEWFVEGVPNVNCTASARLPWNYRYLRAPRPLMGEQPFQLPRNVVIRGASGVIPTSLNIPTGQNGEYEVIFAPSGQIVNANNQRVILWIDDVNNVAKPQLLCLYAATGAIASHPIGPAGQEFSYTRDGQDSGQ